MSVPSLIDTARALVTGDKGLLAMDESNGTCNKRFAEAGIAQTESARRAYRDLIVTTPGLGEFISGAILYDETIRQRTDDGTPIVDVLLHAGIMPGIKVDLGAKDLAGHPGEKVTKGLDGLRARLLAYGDMGARFAKWRDRPRRRHVESRLHRRQRPRAGALCRLVPGSGTGSHRRARGAGGG